MDKDKLKELREYYDNTDLSEAIERATPDDTIVADPMVGITVRFPRSALERVRAVAEARGVKVTALMRDLVERGVANEEQPNLMVSVADLQRLIAERSHPAA